MSHSQTMGVFYNRPFLAQLESLLANTKGVYIVTPQPHYDEIFVYCTNTTQSFLTLQFAKANGYQVMEECEEERAWIHIAEKF